MVDTNSIPGYDGFASLAGVYLLTMLAIATVTDLVSHRIPNALLVPSLAIAAVLGTLTQGIFGLLAAGAGLCVGLAMLLPLYVAGGTAAGDVKLLAVAGAYLGPTGAFFAGMFTFVAGAVFGLAWIAWRMVAGRKTRDAANVTPNAGGTDAAASGSDGRGIADAGFEPGVRQKTGTTNAFAYAPAIFAGCLAAAWYQGWNFFGA